MAVDPWTPKTASFKNKFDEKSNAKKKLAETAAGNIEVQDNEDLGEDHKAPIQQLVCALTRFLLCAALTKAIKLIDVISYTTTILEIASTYGPALAMQYDTLLRRKLASAYTLRDKMNAKMRGSLRTTDQKILDKLYNQQRQEPPTARKGDKGQDRGKGGPKGDKDSGKKGYDPGKKGFDSGKGFGKKGPREENAPPAKRAKTSAPPPPPAQGEQQG